jgi:hypothetical protein
MERTLLFLQTWMLFCSGLLVMIIMMWKVDPHEERGAGLLIKESFFEDQEKLD